MGDGTGEEDPPSPPCAGTRRQGQRPPLELLSTAVCFADGCFVDGVSCGEKAEACFQLGAGRVDAAAGEPRPDLC